MVRLTSGDMCELLDVNTCRFQNWCNEGFIRSANNGKGLGSQREFTVVHLVALMYGLQFIEFGYTWSLVRPIVDFITSFSEKQLKAEFKAGRVIFIPLPGKAPLELAKIPNDGHCYDAINLELVYKRAVKAIVVVRNEQQSAAANTKGGRKRGSAR